MEIKNELKIGITGHRLLPEGSKDGLEIALKQCIKNIIEFESNGLDYALDVVFETPIATGADTLFAEVAIGHFQGEIHLIFPFPVEEYEKDFESNLEQEKFQLLRNHPRVSRTTVVSETMEKSRSELYLTMGKRIVEDIDYLIAIWDELDSGKTGGTSDVVAYAMKMGKNVLVINPNNNPIGIDWKYLPEAVKMSGNNPSENLLKTLFIQFDEAAIKSRKIYKSIWNKSFNLGLIAAFLLAVNSSFDFKIEGHETLGTVAKLLVSSVEFALVIWIMLLVAREKKHGFHKQYRALRFTAEHLRMNNIMVQCGLKSQVQNSRAIHRSVLQYATNPAIALSDKIVSLSCLPVAKLEVKKAVIQELVDEQKQYHATRIQGLKLSNHVNEKWTHIAFYSFLALMLIHILFEIMESNVPYAFLQYIHYEIPHIFHDFLGLFLKFVPVVIARLEARRFINEWERQVQKSHAMLLFFEQIEEDIDNAENDSNLDRVVYLIGENMNSENIDWELFMANKNEILKG